VEGQEGAVPNYKEGERPTFKGNVREEREKTKDGKAGKGIPP